MKFLFLEPFYGGSHKDFADGWIEHSRHSFDLHILSDQFWKWRLRSASLWFAQQIDPTSYDGIVTTSLLRVSDLKWLWGKNCPPVFLYNHESQVSYPVPPGQNMEYEFVIIDITNGLAADCLVFNSHTHLNNFLTELPNVIRHFPEYAPENLEKIFQDKSLVLHPGCRFGNDFVPVKPLEQNLAPLIIWNHRWEFDKQPKVFFRALDEIDSQKIAFRLAILGETRQVCPKDFYAAKERYGNRIIQCGHVGSKQQYFEWLKQGAIVVSTSIQENFGISVVEAIRSGCVPLLPNRLSYPEILPQSFHHFCLYKDYDDLVARLARLLTNPPSNEFRQSLSNAMSGYSWHNVVDYYDRKLESLIIR